jgi:hypothetical protein
MKTYVFASDKYSLSNVSKLAWQHCLELGLTEYQKWALFDFEVDHWADHLDFIFGATKEELENYVEEEEIEDESGNYLDEKIWNSR